MNGFAHRLALMQRQKQLRKGLLIHVCYILLFILTQQTPKSGLKDQISEKLWNGLSEGHRQFLLQMEKKRECTAVDDNILATPIVDDITKMQMPQTESTGI